ncbi:lipopolysaccharide transport periplasmic protein LptA [Helicobacter muridarum]|uniref:Lipopolysaccharide transport periplasmic protein LptA n=2 Tax=Helicobacter muridarum TaxID=216 RepID=A0A4U8TJS1_9HELI|nr:lipopolysaccharide transport periplasmic protein LptA [Helicobacter muridarum]
MMIYRILFIILFLEICHANSKKDTIDIVAQQFKSVGNTTTITGNVKITKGRDTLNADTVIVYTDKERKPISYEAKGNVKFTLITDDNRELRGKSKRLIYNVIKDEYRFYDDAFVQEIGKPNTLRGDEIILTGDGNYADVVGKKNAPARVIFSLEK